VIPVVFCGAVHVAVSDDTPAVSVGAAGGAGTTAIARCTGAAGWYVPSPPCPAVTWQTPTPTSVSVDPDTVHTDSGVALNPAASSDVAVAVSGIVPLASGTDAAGVNVMVWVSLVTVSVGPHAGLAMPGALVSQPDDTSGSACVNALKLESSRE
jgi:hypothetical protein